MILLLILITSTRAFNSKEIGLLLDLVDFFRPPYLDLLDEPATPDPTAFVTNASFPSRILILTAMMNAERLIGRLSLERSPTGGMPLVAVRHGSKVWDSFTKIAKPAVLQSAKWILMTNTPSYASAINDLYIPFDCQFIIANMVGAVTLLTEVYHIAKGARLNTANFGYWQVDQGLVPQRSSFYARRPDFQGHVFNATIKHLRPYTYVKKYKNGSTTFDGYFYEVWKELEYRLKFKTNFVRVLGMGDKILDAMKTENYLFCVSPVVQDAKSIVAVGLTQPIYEAKIHVFGRRPGSELEWDSYLKPFSSDTWLALLGWMFGSAIALALLYRTAWNYQTSEPEATHYIFTFSVCLETAFRAACGQGSDVTPRSPSCRVLFLSIYMTALVLMSAFSAALFSLLTVPVSREPFTSFKQIYETKSYKLGIVPDSDVYEGIKDLAERRPNSDHSKLFRMLEPAGDLPVTVVQALERICRRSDYIFMWDLPGVQLRMQEIVRLCQERITPGGPMVFNEHLGYGTSKRSPYKGIIDLHLIRMKNEGLVHRMLFNTWPPRIPNVPVTWVRVTVDDISPIIYMFALGALLGVIFLAIEHIHIRTKKNQELQKINVDITDNFRHYLSEHQPKEHLIKNWMQRDLEIYNRYTKKIHYN